jgi:hypothetical protein
MVERSDTTGNSCDRSEPTLEGSQNYDPSRVGSWFFSVSVGALLRSDPRLIAAIPIGMKSKSFLIHSLAVVAMASFGKPSFQVINCCFRLLTNS